jgi:hypothetical protein
VTQVPVSADDILAVSAAWELLAGTSPVAGYQRVQVLTVANQAVARMTDAAVGWVTAATAQAETEMPEDPVDGASEAVVMDAALLDRYMAHGFSREEAFALVHATVQARAHAIGMVLAAQSGQGNRGG